LLSSLRSFSSSCCLWLIRVMRWLMSEFFTLLGQNHEIMNFIFREFLHNFWIIDFRWIPFIIKKFLQFFTSLACLLFQLLFSHILKLEQLWLNACTYIFMSDIISFLFNLFLLFLHPLPFFCSLEVIYAVKPIAYVIILCWKAKFTIKIAYQFKI